MIIRKLSEQDYEPVFQLIKNTITQVLSKDYSPAIIANMIAVDANRPRDTAHERDYFVAVEETKIVGIIGIKKNEVKTFFVAPELRGKGIGSQLLAFVEGKILSTGTTEVVVRSTISGKTFYEKHGFLCIEENNDIKVGEEIMKRFLMKRIF